MPAVDARSGSGVGLSANGFHPHLEGRESGRVTCVRVGHSLSFTASGVGESRGRERQPGRPADRRARTSANREREGAVRDGRGPLPLSAV